MMQKRFEKEFQAYMKQVYSGLPIDSAQYKVCRVVFYSGAHTLISAKETGSPTLEFITDMVEEVRDGLKLASHFAKDGIQPEETLADLIESREDD